MEQKAKQYQQKIEDIKQMRETKIVPIKMLFKESTDQTLLLRLKNMGVNPSSNSMDKIWDSETQREYSWSYLFDFSSKNKIWNDEISDTLKEKRGSFRTKIKQEILSTLFRRLYFSFESSGLGFVCLNIENSEIEKQKKEILGEGSYISTESIRQISNSFIRLLGDAWRYEYRKNRNNPNSIQPADSINNLPKKIKIYIEKCAERHKLERENT